MVGGLIGIPLCAVSSDKFGRKPVFLLSLWAVVIVGVANAFAPNYYVFIVLRFFTGLPLHVGGCKLLSYLQLPMLINAEDCLKQSSWEATKTYRHGRQRTSNIGGPPLSFFPLPSILLPSPIPFPSPRLFTPSPLSFLFPFNPANGSAGARSPATKRLCVPLPTASKTAQSLNC